MVRDALKARHESELETLFRRETEVAQLWQEVLGDTGAAGVIHPPED